MFGFEKLISLRSILLVEMGTHFKLLFLPEEILIEVNLYNCQAPGPCSLNPNQVQSGWLVGLQDFSVSPTIRVRQRERVA